MSKEIAQTVGGKRIAWLLAIVAAFALLATVGSQFREARADISPAPTLTGPSGNVAVGATVTYVATVPIASGAVGGNASLGITLPSGVTSATTVCADGGTGAGVTQANPCVISGSAGAAGTITLTVTATVNNAANGTVIGNATSTATAAGGSSASSAPAGTFTVVNVTTSNLGNVVAGSGNLTFAFTVPAGLGVCSDNNAGTGIGTPTAADFVITNGTYVSSSVAGQVVSVVVTPTGLGAVTVAIRTHPDTSTAGPGDCVNSTAATANVMVPVLRHIADNGAVIAQQEINSNVRGSTHTICATDGAGNGLVLPVGITLSNIVVTNGGGYASTADTDPTFSDVIIDTRTVGTSTGTCITWRSLDAGDQTINILYVGLDGVQYNVLWGSGQGIIKEWNRLEDSEVTAGTITGVGNSTTVPVVTRTINLTLNPSSGVYTAAPIAISDLFRGSHTNSAGVKEGPMTLAGVEWRVSRLATSSACGSTTPALPLPGSGWNTTTLLQNGTVGNNPAFAFTPAGCTPGQVVTFVIEGREPGPLGSGTGIVVTQLVRFEFTAQVAAKQVFLAWAGQRIILEHDWRYPAGDIYVGGDNGPISVGDAALSGDYCPFPRDFQVTYVKGSGPGNFLPGLGASTNHLATEAHVWVDDDDSQSFSNDDDIIGDANGSCISRVLFESEDQGQVDIEAFVTETAEESGGLAYTKHAFVIYYMKINTVNVSLATQFSKPTHNGSSLADWANTADLTKAPTNPWDASKDDADNATEWNVSKDLLVRGRVTGWFTNSNPSGRARDDSNPLNVLPADRWVMPNDWALLAGGPADNADGTAAIGTAEQFRPYYDLMTSPNNAALALTDPTGSGYAAVAVVSGSNVTTVAAGNTGTGTAGSPVKVNSCTGLVAGLGIVFSDAGTTRHTVASCASGDLVLTAARASAPASGVAVRANLTGIGSAAFPLPVSACTFLPAGTPVRIGATAAGVVSTCASNLLVVSAPVASAAAAPAGLPILAPTSVPFEGPYSLIDIPGLAPSFGGAALSNLIAGQIRDTILPDGDINMWDAPMPPAMVSVAIRGTGFIKQVLKDEIYYLGTPNTASVFNGGTQTYPNPFYISNIPDSPFIPAVSVGGGYLWDSWGGDGPGGLGDGPYYFWEPVRVGVNSAGFSDTTLNATDNAELAIIRGAYGDNTIARDLVVYTDNHGEFMVAANGDFKTDLTACQTNVLAGGKHCKPGDKVGTGTISATADYPDFRGKHFPVLSNSATVDWTWGGYKDVTIEKGETDQYKYIVFHALDRDGFCSPLTSGAVLLHSVLTKEDDKTDFSSLGARYNGDPDENVDFLIDSGEGIIIGQSGGGTINDGKQFATGVTTFSVAENNPATSGILEFPLSPLAAEGQTDECQAWIKVSNSLLGILNVLTIAKDDEGNIGFDRVIDLTNTHSYTLNFRWSLITWVGADAISVNDAIKGTGTSGKNPGGNDISASVTAIYGWDAAAQQWLGFFPSGVNVPGANDLTSLKTGDAYWIAITGPSSVTWTVASNVN